MHTQAHAMQVQIKPFSGGQRITRASQAPHHWTVSQNTEAVCLPRRIRVPATSSTLEGCRAARQARPTECTALSAAASCTR